MLTHRSQGQVEASLLLHLFHLLAFFLITKVSRHLHPILYLFLHIPSSGFSDVEKIQECEYTGSVFPYILLITSRQMMDGIGFLFHKINGFCFLTSFRSKRATWSLFTWGIEGIEGRGKGSGREWGGSWQWHGFSSFGISPFLPSSLIPIRSFHSFSLLPSLSQSSAGFGLQGIIILSLFLSFPLTRSSIHLAFFLLFPFYAVHI